MKLKEELGFKNDFEILEHEALLNIYYTTIRIKKRALEFFEPFGTTDVQFNLMMLLQYQSGEEDGLSQVALSDMLLVNRANITSLIDRMEKAKLVARTPVVGDRRTYMIKLTNHGKALLNKVEDAYLNEIKKIMSVLSKDDLKKLIKMNEKIREHIL